MADPRPGRTPLTGGRRPLLTCKSGREASCWKNEPAPAPFCVNPNVLLTKIAQLFCGWAISNTPGNCSDLLTARAYAETGLECSPIEGLSSLINPGGDHHDRAVHRQLRPQERCILCPETSERHPYSDRHNAAILLDARSRLRIFSLCTYARGFS